MLEIKVTSIAYNLDQTSSATTDVLVALQGYGATRESANLSVAITADDLTDGATLDDLSRKDIEVLARKKAAEYINPTEAPTEEAPDTTPATEDPGTNGVTPESTQA